MKYSELNDKERWAAIRAGVRAGYNSIDDIEKAYNEYADGGRLYGGNLTLSQQLTPKKLTDYNQGDWSAIYDKQQAANNARLAAAQAEWDKMHDEVVNNPDAYSSVDVYKYIGKRPESIQDVNRNEKFENDAKVANAIGMAAVATPYAPQVLTNPIVQPIAKSMMSGIGADAVSKLATGKSVAEHTKDAIQFATGLNPRNNAVSNFVVDTFGNPFYGFTNETARGFVNVGKRIHNNTSNTIKPISKKEIETAWQKAVDAGDIAEAQRLRDLHFGLSNSKYKEPLFRGTDENSPIMDLSKMQVNDVPAIYLTPYEKYAKGYGDNVRKFYLNTQNPWIDTFDKEYSYISIETAKRNLEKAIQKEDKQKIEKWKKILNDIKDTDAAYRYNISANLTPETFDGIPPEILGRDVNKIKLADAITYDDAGNIIPLSKRDNFNINDIRYNLLPAGVGLSGYSLINNAD